MNRSSDTKTMPEIEKLQARLRLAEEQAQSAAAGALGACSFTFLLSLHPAVFAQRQGISLAALAARIAALDNRPYEARPIIPPSSN